MKHLNHTLTMTSAQLVPIRTLFLFIRGVFRTGLTPASLLLTTTWLLILSVVGRSQAQNSPEEPLSQPAGIGVILMVDNSGSNDETDPGSCRWIAVQMVADMLTSSDYLSVIPFTDDVDREAPGYVPLSPVTDALREQVKAFAEKVDPEGSTDLVNPIIEASRQIRDRSPGDIPIYAIYLSDGQQYAERRHMDRDLENATAVFRTREIPIHTLALSNEADLRSLQKIALLTGGSSRLIRDSRELLMAFREILWSELPIWTAVDTVPDQNSVGHAEFPINLLAQELILFVFEKGTDTRGRGAPKGVNIRVHAGDHTSTQSSDSGSGSGTSRHTSSYWFGKILRPPRGDCEIEVRGAGTHTLVVGLRLDEDPFTVVSPARRGRLCVDEPIVFEVESKIGRPEGYDILAELRLLDDRGAPVALADGGRFPLRWDSTARRYIARVFTSPHESLRNLEGTYTLSITFSDPASGFHRRLPQFNIAIGSDPTSVFSVTTEGDRADAIELDPWRQPQADLRVSYSGERTTRFKLGVGRLSTAAGESFPPEWIEVERSEGEMRPRNPASARVSVSIPQGSSIAPGRYSGWITAEGGGVCTGQGQIALVVDVRPFVSEIRPNRAEIVTSQGRSQLGLEHTLEIPDWKGPDSTELSFTIRSTDGQFEAADAIELIDSETNAPINAISLGRPFRVKVNSNLPVGSYEAAVTFTAPFLKPQDLEVHIIVHEVPRIVMMDQIVDFGSFPVAEGRTRSVEFEWNKTAQRSALRIEYESRVKHLISPGLAGGVEFWEGADQGFDFAGEQGSSARREITLRVSPELGPGRYSIPYRLIAVDPETSVEPDTFEIRFDRPEISIFFQNQTGRRLAPDVPFEVTSSERIGLLRVTISGTDQPIGVDFEVTFTGWAETQAFPPGSRLVIGETAFDYAETGTLTVQSAKTVSLGVAGGEKMPIGNYSCTLNLSSSEGNLRLSTSQLVIHFNVSP